MKSKRMYRLLSWILALTMVFSLTVSPVYASDTSSTITTVNADETEDETTVEEETTTDNSAAETLQAQIDALPSVERVSAMDTDAQNEVYAQVSTIWDAYYELTEAEQEQVDASLLEALSDYFNGLTVEAEETATVATIGENSYTSLADAIAAVTDSTQTTITLTTNVTESNGLTISDTQNIVLELSSYTLDLGSAYIEVKGILTIQGNGTITTSNDGEGVIYANGTSAKVTLSSGSITNTGSQGYGIGCWYGGTAVINGGSITSQSAALAGNNTTGNMNFEVNGGTLTTTYGAAIYMPGQGTLNITGGTINGGISLRMGQVTISGGTINATTNSSNIDSITEYYNYSGNVWLADAIYVFGGTYTSEDTTNGNSLSLSISGGTFNCTNGQGNAVTVYNLGKVEQTSTVTISGGTFTTDTKNGNGYAVVAFSDLGVTDSTGSYGTSNNTVSTSISGGTFTGDVSEYLVSGLTQDEDGKVVTDETAYVAQIGETKYATVTEAITAATDGTETTITLLTDTEEDVVIPAGKVIALDLNGKTIKNSSSHTITNYGTLTVTDSSTESTGTVNNVTHAKAAIVNYGTAYLYGGTFTRSAEAGSSSSNNGGNSYYTIKNYNQMTIGDGTGTVTVENNGCYSSCIANGYQNTSDKANAENITGSVTPTLTINENASVSGGINCVKNDDCATLIIKGGSFTNTNGVAIQNHSTAIINGGTFTANTCAVYNCGCDSTLDVGSLTITNGTFEGGTYAVYDDSLEDVAEVIISGGTFTGSTSSIATSSSSAATFAISGGTFNSDVSEYAIEGYEATETSESGIYEITALTATSNGVVASVTASDETITYYKSLANALNAATNGSTVTLLADVELNESLIFEPSDSDSVTLDLNGKTITFAYDDNNQFNGETLTDGAWGLKVVSGTLTIKDSSGDKMGSIQTYDEDTYVDVVGASGSAKLIIESGNFTTNSIYEAVVFATGSAKVEITGGTFTNSASGYEYNSEYTHGLTLNIGNSSSATISVTGGTFVGRSPAEGDDYVSTVTTFVADGYEATETSTGVYTVAAEISYVAVAYTSEVSNGTYYTTFDDVVAAIDDGTITDGMTIMLLDDATWTLTANKKITIGLTFDLNGKTLTLSGSKYVYFAPASSTSMVKFTDSSYTSGDLTGRVVGTYKSTSYGMIRFNNACNVVLENVSFENTSYACVMEIGAASGVDINLTANNCSFINSNTSDKYSSKIYSQGVLLYGNSTSATGTISFKNCTFQTSDDGENGAALKICQGKSSTVSPITIDGCTIVNNGTTTSCSALQFGTSLNSKVTVTNSTMTATTGYAVDAYYDITSTADITLGEGNIVNGVVNIRNGGTRNYTVNVTGGRFDNGTSDAIVAASDESTSTSILNLLNLTGGYFKTDVSDLVANGYACVANTAEAAGDAYNSIYADAGYTYTVAAVIGATDYYILDSSNEKHYFDSLSAALASTDYTGGTVYFAADCTLTASDLANINTYGWTVQNYGGATLTYEDTLSSLVSTLTSGNVEVTTLMYKYDDTTAHTISNVSITNGVLVSGTLSGIDCTDADNWAYYTTGILAEGYVYYLTGSTYTIESKDSVNAQAKIDDILYCRLLSKAVSTAVALNSSDTSVHTVTMLQNATTSISLSGGDTLILDMNGKTLTGYVYVNGTTSDGGAVTLKNGTITQSSNNNFVVYTNGTLKNVTLTLDNLTVTHNGSTGIAVYLAAGGTTTITDCTISGATGIVARSSDISITDTTVTATGEYGEYDNTYSGGAQSTGDAIILIASGYPGGAPNVTTFSGVKAYSNNGKAVVLETYTGITEESEDYFNTTQFIKDGYYSNDVTEYCVDGMCTTTTVYEVGDITYTYEISSAVASITVDGVTTYYSTIEKALAGAADGKTIVLLADVTVMSDAIISTSVTLDLNDFDFGVASGVSLTISEGKGVSIVDDGEDNSGIVYNYGIITVNGSLDISDLGYTTNGSSGGLMGQTNGKIVLGASSVFTVPGVWATQWSTYFASQYSTYTSDTTTNASLIGYSDCGTSGLWSPNVPSATGASGIFYSAEAGATVISGDNSWTCTTTFENLTENPSTLYWMMKKTQAKLYARSLTLDGSIGVNYYVDANGLTEDEMKGYTVKFTVDGTESTAVFDASSYRNDLNGSTKYYRFTVTVTALQMAKTITAELQYNGTTIQTNTYSVQQYCETAISGEWDEKDLCAALLNYGGYAQNYANSDISNLANANLLSVYSGWSDPVSSYDADLSSYADKVSVSETLPDEVSADTDGNHFYATLLMESKTVIRIYFNSSNASALTFKVDDITLDINSTADGDTGYGAYTYYVEFKVPANMLDETYTVTVTNGNTDGTITYSALAYVYNMVAGSTATDALKNVCKALYYYSIAAEAYTNWY